jgi:hypothetical protein
VEEGGVEVCGAEGVDFHCITLRGWLSPKHLRTTAAPLGVPDGLEPGSRVPSRRALSWCSAHTRVSFLTITMAPMIDPTATVQTHISLEHRLLHSVIRLPYPCSRSPQGRLVSLCERLMRLWR